MSHLIVTVPAAALVFASTNIDDLVVLTFLFLASRTVGRPRPWQIVAGQGVGIAVLVVLATVAALGLLVVPTRWVGLIGVIPLAVGLWKLIPALRRPPDSNTPPSLVTGLTGIASITIINGADNIAVFTPLFRSLGMGQVLAMLVVFIGMFGVWCAVAAWLGTRLSAVTAIRHLSYRVTPIVFIAVGAIILAQTAIQ